MCVKLFCGGAPGAKNREPRAENAESRAENRERRAESGEGRAESGMLFVTLSSLLTLAVCVDCTHIFSLDDFSRVKTDTELAKHVEPVLKRLKTFKVAVHPRIRLFYHLLKRSMAEYSHRTGDELYSPYVYRERRGGRADGSAPNMSAR